VTFLGNSFGCYFVLRANSLAGFDLKEMFSWTYCKKYLGKLSRLFSCSCLTSNLAVICS
jgi:hypothetical protein